MLSICIFADKLHVVSHAPDGKVASQSESFQNVYLLIIDGEHSRCFDFSQYCNLVVCHSYGYDRILLEVETQLLTYKVLSFIFCESADMESSHYREVNGALIADKILL